MQAHLKIYVGQWIIHSLCTGFYCLMSSNVLCDSVSGLSIPSYNVKLFMVLLVILCFLLGKSLVFFSLFTHSIKVHLYVVSFVLVAPIISKLQICCSDCVF